MNILRKSIIALFALTAFGTTAAQASGTDGESTKKIKLEKAYRFRAARKVPFGKSLGAPR